MKGTALIWLCALALAQASISTSQGNSDIRRTCNCNLNEAADICAPLNTDGLFVSHEHCNRFYRCYNGVPVAFECPSNLLYNTEAEICDWPENVKCGDRPIVEADNGEDCDDDVNADSTEIKDSSKQEEEIDNGGSDSNIGGGSDSNIGGGNCDPSEAPAICAADNNEGVLVAHENCNYFYKCSYGLPVALKCPGNLLFDPQTDQCDWPENVECGDRIISDAGDNGGSDNDGSNNGGDENGGADNGGSDNDGSDNGGSDNGTIGVCNCNPSEAPEICAADQSEGVLVAHENCNYFYKCAEGLPVALKCPGNLLFNPYTDQCDWPENVKCGDRIIPDTEDNGGSDNDGNNNGGSENGGTDNGGSDNGGVGNGGSDNGNVGVCNCNPSEAPEICAADQSEGVLVAHENCNYFYKCAEGLPVALKCPGNLLFNPYTDQCDWPENVKCGDRIIPDTEDNGGSDNDGNNNGGSENGGTDTGGSDNGGVGNGGSDNGNVGVCNCNPSEAPEICAGDQSEGVLVAHENCNYFYKCSYGLPVALKCPGNLLFNPYTEQCDWPENVKCGDRIIPDTEDNGGSDNDGNNNGGSENGGTENGGSDNGGSDNGGSDNGNVGVCNCNPGEAQEICAADQSEGVLVAHENCNYFYKCSYGLPVALKCPGNLLFNPYTEQCDWPENVKCGDRIIPDADDNGGSANEGNNNGGSENGGTDNGGSDNGGVDNGGSDNGNVGVCNCNPGEAQEICAADQSEGVLVAHENCNYFYKCSYGLPVALKCPGNLLFNPYTEQCDWPENVKCGDRIIPDADDNGGSDNDGNNNGGSENGGADNGGSDNGGSDNGGSDNGNVGVCNCNPGEAQVICAADQSEGVLVAHENCNYFYKCADGLPVALKCPGNLLFNPYTDYCDWPENVKCGDRIIPDEENNGGSDNEGSDNGGSDNGSSENGGSDNGGNNGGSDNGGSDNNNVGGGNCDPSEAPAICAADESEGVLVAHENCNYFYKCSNGLPVAFRCPGNLLFNPTTDQCDWPENVECGDRIIPDEEDNGGSDNGGGDNGGSDNSGTDNGGNDNNNVGGGNCDPSEAPAICAADESEGVLVAHENCNYFYKCSNGLPVALKCPGNLLFNPTTDQCDWPENVECGDRIIPDEEDNGGSDNGGGDNGGSDNSGTDNGGNDNNNVGGGNCDPSEAPAICAADESEGILVAHENCNYFYKCSNGLPVALKCPGNLLFNPTTDQCDWPENVECGDRIIPDEEDNGGSDNGSGDNGGSGNGNSDNGGSDNGGSDNDGSDNNGTDNGGNDNNNVGGGNCDPSEAPAICAADESEGILVAHENCNYFYKCSNGLPVALKCPGNLLFNPTTDQCDWPEKVECGNRIIPDEEDNGGSDNDSNNNGGSENGGADNGGSDNGGSDNGGSDNGSVGVCNCNPSEAPEICASDQSEGVLVAHESCNYFYKCSYGLPVALKCPGNLLFNPYTEQCDWPENVKCGDRIIPDAEDNDGSDNDGNNNGGSENGGADNGGSDNGGSDNGGSDNGNVGVCNCYPSEAPEICAADQSEGVLVAHENCNYFYKCAEGLPVALKCPGNLLFNPYTEYCDWPENVKCGDRIIPDEGDNGGSDNEGTENGGSDNGGSDNGGNNNGDSDNGSSDNGGSDNNNVGGGNCDPSEAPAICAADQSEGVLVAHEYCNYFYKCAYGLPVALRCPGDLLFDPATDQCDWPENVNCGERVIPDESSNGGTDNGDSDNGGNDNGGSDNGGSDNGGTDNGGEVNDNPSLAPSICASTGSNGVLVAHEKCNKYYMCVNNVPVAIKCSGTLLFNPLVGVCDWPRNVDCGDRVIPEVEDSGTCNCNSRQAPSICAADDSNGKQIAHELCNQFYVCSEGIPVARACPRSLLYDPVEEACESAQDVSCENRVLYYSLDKHLDARRA